VAPNRVLPTVLTALGSLLLVGALAISGNHFLGHCRAGRTLSSATLTPGLGPVPTSNPTSSTSPAPALPPAVVPDAPGVPVSLIVTGHRVDAVVSAEPFNPDGSLFVPPDPRAVSWASQDAGPGGSYGTTILVGHINYRGVPGAFSDLAEYQVGQIITVVLADGRRMNYAVAAPPIEVNKDQVGPRRQELFDQSNSYGLVGQPKSGRLLLLSCGGAFDNRTGQYESNIFVYALPA